MFMFFFFYRLRRPPGSNRHATLFPSPPLFRSAAATNGARRPRAGAASAKRDKECYVRRHREGNPTARIRADHVGPELGMPELPQESRDRRSKPRSEEHTSELQSLMRISYAVCCLKKKKQKYR